MKSSPKVPENFLTIIFVADHCPSVRESETVEAYWLSARDVLAAGEFRADSLRELKSSEKVPAVKTPWVVFLEADEFLDSDGMEDLLAYCEKNGPAPAQLSVQRFVAANAMSRFAWVTTQPLMEHSPADIRKFTTLETRLIPTNMSGRLKIRGAQPESPARFSLHFDQCENETVRTCPALISREAAPVPLHAVTRPGDRDIFHYGHESYFDDRVFSARFEWPHTAYHTIRYDHVPSVMEALKQGLSNPRIVTYTLIYLLRFRHFPEALELIKLIPEHWYARHPDLANGAAAIYFINGQSQKGLDLYEGFLKKFPDSDWIVRNAIKLNILADRYDRIDEFLKLYRDAKGEELQDDYYEHFKTVHGKSPVRTASVSACMIIRDEEKTIERAITSVRQFADEIIVVDTGSLDRSAEIAASLGAHVYHFPWNDDFSAARNYAIDKASCDYVFMLDGDEYIPPFFFMESQTMKKLLPLRDPIAYCLPIGFYFNENDWLFLIQEEGNFRVENSPVRIFPRQPGLLYSGRIVETIEPSLANAHIAVHKIPEHALRLVHDQVERKTRIERKAPIYDKMENPEEECILIAIRDFAYLGRTVETSRWLQSFYHRHPDRTTKVRIGLKLAGIMASTNAEDAESLYRDLAQACPEDPEIFSAYASYLIMNNRIKEISDLNIPDGPPEGKLRMEIRCIRSLKHFESGEKEAAFDLLADVLDENTYEIFPQAVRLYYLALLNNLEGVVSTLDMLFNLIGERKDFSIDSIEDVFTAAESLYAAMLKTECRKESSLILQGITQLGMTWGIS